MKRTIRKMLRSAVVLGLILALCGGSALAMNIPVWINNSKAPIYVAPGQVGGSLHAGTGVYVTDVKKGWAQINYKDHVGYIHTRYLTLVNGPTGYLKTSSYVYKSASTSSEKSGPLDEGTEVKVVGMDGKFFQITNGKTLGYIPKDAISKAKPSDLAIMASKVQLADWSKVNHAFPKGSNVQMYDIMSGSIIKVHRLGGENHAEMEPATAEDTAKLLKACGGKFSWNSRPVILRLGNVFLAAAINTMPHGEQSIKNNNYDGQFCMHFPGSKTHGTESVNVNHQAAIHAAYKWAQATK